MEMVKQWSITFIMHEKSIYSKRDHWLHDDESFLNLVDFDRWGFRYEAGTNETMFWRDDEHWERRCCDTGPDAGSGLTDKEKMETEKELEEENIWNPDAANCPVISNQPPMGGCGSVTFYHSLDTLQKMGLLL